MKRIIVAFVVSVMLVGCSSKMTEEYPIHKEGEVINVEGIDLKIISTSIGNAITPTIDVKESMNLRGEGYYHVILEVVDAHGKDISFKRPWQLYVNGKHKEVEYPIETNYTEIESFAYSLEGLNHFSSSDKTIIHVVTRLKDFDEEVENAVILFNKDLGFDVTNSLFDHEWKDVNTGDTFEKDGLSVNIDNFRVLEELDYPAKQLNEYSVDIQNYGIFDVKLINNTDEEKSLKEMLLFSTDNASWQEGYNLYYVEDEKYINAKFVRPNETLDLVYILIMNNQESGNEYRGKFNNQLIKLNLK